MKKLIEFVQRVLGLYRERSKQQETVGALDSPSVPSVIRSPERIIADSHAAYLDYPYPDEEDRQRIGEAYAEQCSEEIEDLIDRLAQLPRRSTFKKPVYGIHLDSIRRLVGFKISASLIPDVLSRPLDFQSTGMVDGLAAIQVRRDRIVTPQEVRGKIMTFHKKLIEHRFLKVVGNKAAVEEAHIYAYSDSLWKNVSQPIVRNHAGGRTSILGENAYADEHLEEVLLSVGMQYATEFFWLAFFSAPGSNYVLQVAMKPQTALNLFKHRDKPTHAKRRKAIQHLVSPHWRNLPDKSEMQTFVREHRRGTDWFEWMDLHCAIVPALRDVQRLDFAKVERDLLKKGGSDRRVIV